MKNCLTWWTFQMQKCMGQSDSTVNKPSALQKANPGPICSILYSPLSLQRVISKCTVRSKLNTIGCWTFHQVNGLMRSMVLGKHLLDHCCDLEEQTWVPQRQRMDSSANRRTWTTIPEKKNPDEFCGGDTSTSVCCAMLQVSIRDKAVCSPTSNNSNEGNKKDFHGPEMIEIRACTALHNQMAQVQILGTTYGPQSTARALLRRKT